MQISIMAEKSEDVMAIAALVMQYSWNPPSEICKGLVRFLCYLLFGDYMTYLCYERHSLLTIICTICIIIKASHKKTILKPYSLSLTLTVWVGENCPVTYHSILLVGSIGY